MSPQIDTVTMYQAYCAEVRRMSNRHENWTLASFIASITVGAIMTGICEVWIRAPYGLLIGFTIYVCLMALCLWSQKIRGDALVQAVGQIDFSRLCKIVQTAPQPEGKG